MDPRNQPEDLRLAETQQINTLRLNRKFEYGVHEYRFDIQPQLDAENFDDPFCLDPLFLSYHVMERVKSLPVMDSVQDGRLYLPQNIGNFRMKKISDPFTGNPELKYQLTMCHQREVPVAEQVPFFDKFFKMLQHYLNRDVMREYRAEFKRKDLVHFWLSSSPGEIIEVEEKGTNEKEKTTEILIKSDISARVAKQDNIYELMKLLLPCGDAFLSVAKVHFIGSIVKVIYDDSKEYFVNDIDETRNPNSTFLWNGEELSYVDFFAREHNIKIQDHRQPLFIDSRYVSEEGKVKA